MSSENRTLNKAHLPPASSWRVFRKNFCPKRSPFLGSENHRAAFPGDLREEGREAAAAGQPFGDEELVNLRAGGVPELLTASYSKKSG